MPATPRIASPDFAYETDAMSQGARRVVGVDEVGRGPLAGPVTAAAVWLDPDDIPDGLNDSKQLSAARREALLSQLLKTADVSVAHASVAEIDEMNILQAAHLAMRRAIAGLSLPPDFLLIDGNRMPSGLEQPARTIVKGDARSLSIAAASIAAKVARDRIMLALAAEFPGYGWETNVGYPTKAHKLALFEHGITPHHRRSFRPVHNILYPDTNLTN